MKNRIILLLFVMFLAFFFVATMVTEDRDFSDMENRYLAKNPKISIKTIVNGDYMEKVEKYMADQIVLKDSLVSLKTDTEKVLGKTGMNGVYFGKNQYYIKKYEPNEETYKKNLMFIDEFAKKAKQTSNVYMFLAPNVQSIYKEYIPASVTMKDASKDVELAEKVLKNVKVIDPTRNITLHKREQLYYRTDHHWTQNGAYYGYQSFCEALGLKYMQQKEYKRNIVSKDFYGSLYSKAPYSGAKKDSIVQYVNPNGKYVLQSGKKTIRGLYIDSNLQKKDKYTYYLNGNQPFITVKSNATSGKKALIIKDSYSHSMLPFLADQYETMDVVDLRYYHTSLAKQVAKEKYDDVIFIYNMDFITTDDNFVWLTM